MPLHIIVVDRRADFPWTGQDRLVVPAREFVTEAARRLPTSARVINLCGDFSYLSMGYYASLLAEARGQKVIPSVDVMLDLHWKRLLRIALPEINELVARTFLAEPSGGDQPLPATIFFGVADDDRLAAVGRRLFELFRCPVLRVQLRHKGTWRITEIEPISPREIRPEQRDLLREALNRYTHAVWRRPREVAPARYSIAILHDPKEALPPSNPKALERFVRVGAQMSVDVELITRADYGRLAEYDALLIRETTNLDHHTYRFAKKAEAEGMPVIDDPRSILKCANKIYLAEMLQANGIPAPRTLILDKRRIGQVERELGFPAVLKVPDGSFSRGVFRAGNSDELRALSDGIFKDTDLVIAQEYMRTAFDWRVGVLDGKPLFVCQYFMARDHWQIVNHSGAAGPEAGRATTFAVDAAPPRVVEIATRAASLIGNGLYGVDLKETPEGVFVVEINDNPNIDAGVEDAVLKDDLYRAVIAQLVRRLERRMQTIRTRAVNGAAASAAAGAVLIDLPEGAGANPVDRQRASG